MWPIVFCNNGITLSSLEEISKQISEKYDSLPKNQTCQHSKYPDRMYCEEKQRIPMVAICESCSEYISRMKDKN